MWEHYKSGAAPPSATSEHRRDLRQARLASPRLRRSWTLHTRKCSAIPRCPSASLHAQSEIAI
ncbi:hypothetical protein COCSUDRAFT_33885 [Coccomyxa subellipsoidea C-169]|uniref:Uncharacterized protein n=1 Tax=Coccomyxa subellipsoidea (strain C-169) TaxID=574566 RepID=I0YQU3_COCSC|nr:hypothetical protein COCSUDRAFT_33885 [Coccomyxa subellipsoidea C-169]EIE20762.1 hypothetical protein COCSUDRAFT_33885 [Coccomyxa subellipsoidea C-169]|eukprot:XP_005645306.1 hypothetical protein COCSUDRAFT_33885 [Coccomyxa subellipsoidea C-169]